MCTRLRIYADYRRLKKSPSSYLTNMYLRRERGDGLFNFFARATAEGARGGPVKNFCARMCRICLERNGSTCPASSLILLMYRAATEPHSARLTTPVIQKFSKCHVMSCGCWITRNVLYFSSNFSQ